MDLNKVIICPNLTSADPHVENEQGLPVLIDDVQSSSEFNESHNHFAKKG